MNVDIDWTPEQRVYRERFLAFGREVVQPGGLTRDQTGAFDADLWRAVGESGLLGITTPTEFGGDGKGVLEFAAAMEGFAEGGLDASIVFSVLVQVAMVIEPLLQVGTPAQKARWLPVLASGQRKAAFAVTEPHGGSDVFEARTTLRIGNDDELLLSGSKWSVTDAPYADMAIVLGRVEGLGASGLSMFLVDLAGPTVEREGPFDLMGCRAAPTGALRFTNHPVDPEHGVLGKLGDGVPLTRLAFNMERLLAANVGVGFLQAVLDHAVTNLSRNESFGRPLQSYQYVQGRFVEIRKHLEFHRLLTRRALWLAHTKQRFNLEASLAKLSGAQALHDAALHAVLLLGNRGYRRDLFPFERLCRDAVGLMIAGGSEEVQKMAIWAELHGENRS
ncbi:MAG: acyl-CoA dehydrogenase family protein [Alphaproteobacteria bacterium]|nr:acyl-CoA dehydrogenase family protein [Alphaproteobacteria bacterium]